ncbi:hypothetical protein FRC12_008571 [Ceratobasidium sp. 428]|nr:hypothetical protein FRC12_008571 [Ceratobasidium sp. 428]
MLSSPSTTRPRPPSHTRRSANTTSPVRMRTQSHTPAPSSRVRLVEPDAPPPYEHSAPNTQRHSLTEIDDMLNVAGSVVRNRERELETAALASRSLLEENKLMFAKREALLARLPISPRSSLSSSPVFQQQQQTNRSSSWSTCSDDSDADLDGSMAPTPRGGMTPPDPLEAHRIITPSHSAAGSLDLSNATLPPAARLVPTQAERIAALHAGLVSPAPSSTSVGSGLSRANSNSSNRRVSVSPAAVSHLQDANAALLARVEELEEATAKAQTDGAARMRRLQAEAESLRARLGEAERANEGLRTEAEREREKLRVRTQSAGPVRSPMRRSVDAEEGPRDYAPSATWKPEFRSLRGGSGGQQLEPPKTPKRSLTTSTAASRAHRTQSNATPPSSTRPSPVSPLKHTPLKPSLLRHQRANSLQAGLGMGKPGLVPLSGGLVGTVLEEQSETEGGGSVRNRSPSVGSVKPSPTRTSVGILPFPTSPGAGDDEMDMSPSSTRLLAQELVAKINELRSTNEEILQQRDSLKEMLQVAESEADELKRVCERLENEIERGSDGTASGGEAGGGGVPSGRRSRASGGPPSDRERARGGAGSDRDQRARGGPGSGSDGGRTRSGSVKGLELSPLGLGDLDEEMPAGWTGSVRGRKRAPGGALESLAAELGVSAEIQAPTDDDVTDLDVRTEGVDLASELMNAGIGAVPKPTTTPTTKTFGLPHGPVTPKRSASRNGRVTPNMFGSGPSRSATTPASVESATTSAKRGLGNRGMASRAKTNPRRVRKALSSVVFSGNGAGTVGAGTGKALPSPVSSPTAPEMVVSVSPVDIKVGGDALKVAGDTLKKASDLDKVLDVVTPERSGEARREFVTPEVYLTPASSLRIPGGAPLSALTDDEDAKSPVGARGRKDSTMAQLRAGLDPLLANIVQTNSGAILVPPPASAVSPVSPSLQGKQLVRRKPSNLRLLFADERNMEPWETKLRDLYSEIRAMEQEDGGMSSAGEDGWRGSRRARALGRLSLRRRVEDGGGVSDYAADDSEACDLVTPVNTTNNKKIEEEEKKRAAGFELARKLHQKSMSTFLEVLLLVQFAVVLIVFVYTAVRRGPKAVLGNQRRS